MSRQEGTVVKSTGIWYLVQTGDQLVEARIRGKFRLHGKKITNPVAVGDKVTLVKQEDGDVLIEEILPRTNFVVRQSPRQKHHVHLLASNIDQAMLIMTIVSPNLKQGFIDRFLLMTEPHDIPVIIVLNKRDLWKEEEWELFGALKFIYEKLGYTVLDVSSIKENDRSKLLQHLKDKITLVSGQSGVGKTTLLNMLDPSLELKTQELSDYTGKGQHTTTFAEMFELRSGGKVIDTPGIKTLSFNNLEPMDVAHNFREIFTWSKQCKYNNCLHRNEPHCAVKSAVERGEIMELRYINYLQILDELDDQNYWERHKVF